MPTEACGSTDVPTGLNFKRSRDLDEPAEDVPAVKVSRHTESSDTARFDGQILDNAFDDDYHHDQCDAMSPADPHIDNSAY